MNTLASGRAEFAADLGKSLRAWRTAPALPLISVALSQALLVPDELFWIGFPVAMFGIGWLGTERIWYLRIFNGKDITRQELWRLTWAFFWRFLRLGLLMGVAFLPVIALALRHGISDPDRLQRAMSSIEVIALGTVLGLVVDFGLTFVTPALAFSTRRVRDALQSGIALLRREWPRTAWYALVPPLVLVLAVRTWQPVVEGWIAAILSALSVLINVWFKGAAAAFYLRRIPVGDDGAAFTDREPEPTGEARFARFVKGCLVAVAIFVVVVFIMNLLRASA